MTRSYFVNVVKNEEKFYLNLTDKNTGKLAKEYALYRLCNICGSNSTEILFTKWGLDFVKCKKCGFTYVNPILNEKALRRKYEDTKTDLYSKEMIALAKKGYYKLIKQFEKYRKNNSILDVGCGIGTFLSVAKEKGWNVHGIDFMKKNREYAKKNFNINISGKSLEEMNYKSNSFDIIVMDQVLEHLTDPSKMLSDVYRLLRKGGLLYMAMPNGGCFAMKLLGKSHVGFCGDHLNYFDKKTIRKILKKINFRDIKVGTTHFELYDTLQFFFKKVNKESVKKMDNLADAQSKGGILNFIYYNIAHPFTIKLAELLGIGDFLVVKAHK